ncbi:MAG: hypothetical protein ACK5LC_10730 [Coprobacillaceae bacterium]
MDAITAKRYRDQFQDVADEIDAVKRKLQGYDMSITYTNSWFEGADLSYQPEKALDEKATVLVDRSNAIRTHFEDVISELDAIKTKAQGKVSYYQNIMDEEDE